MPQPFSHPLQLDLEQRLQLEALLRAPSTPQGLVFRCQIVLRCADADNPSNLQIANELDCDRLLDEAQQQYPVFHVTKTFPGGNLPNVT